MSGPIQFYIRSLSIVCMLKRGELDASGGHSTTNVMVSCQCPAEWLESASGGHTN